MLIASAASVLLVADLSRPPAAQLTTRAALAGIHVYQATLSPIYERTGVQCRFKITCSHYGEAVVRDFGALKGGWLAFKRVLRCGPWTPMGTDDPPPVSSKLQVQSSKLVLAICSSRLDDTGAASCWSRLTLNFELVTLN